MPVYQDVLMGGRGESDLLRAKSLEVFSVERRAFVT
jgi:hypothetical protein